MQVQEVAEHEPACKIYLALTKCDLLERPAALSNQGAAALESGNSHVPIDACSYLPVRAARSMARDSFCRQWHLCKAIVVHSVVSAF